MTAEEKRNKELAILKATNMMLDKSYNDTILHGNQEDADLILTAKKENEKILNNIGYKQEDLEDVKFKKPSKKYIDSYNKKYNKKNENIEEENKIDNTQIIESKADYNYNLDIESDVQYDMLPLPSKGEPYKKNDNDIIDRIPVAFLTASDENIITSPNLYRDGKITEILLQRKILDKNIDYKLLCKGDRDAILLWLRATGYGPEFPLTIHDNESGQDFDTVIDLSKIKTKEFVLKSDENGLFDYTTNNGDLIKFRFLNGYDEVELNKMVKEDNLNVKKYRLNRALSEIRAEFSDDNEMSKTDKNKIINSINNIEEWVSNIKTSNSIDYEKSITNTMFLSIVSVNGTSDKKYIKKYINNMPAKEAFKFRKYIVENEPGMDLNIKVDRPENLGGGSIETFLTIEPSIFINIA